MTNWAKMTGFAAMLAVALAGSLHWALYDSSQVTGVLSGNQTTGDYVTEAFTGILVLATLALMVATVGLVFLSQRQIEDSRIIQRAYVKASPRAPGIEFEFEAMNVTIEIRNHGVTPARVTDVVLTAIAFPNGQDLPAEPAYIPHAEEHVGPAFLVANDFIATRNVLRIPGGGVNEARRSG